jgi:tRNA nucleotidyltransferase/poly(A) polymerase
MVIHSADVEAVLAPLQFLVCRELVLSRDFAYIIGGAIRDYYFSYPIDDVDFMIPEEDPLKGIERIQDILKAAPEVSSVRVHTPLTPYRTAKIEIHSDTASLVFDIVFPRKETYAHPAAKPEVFPGTFEEDIARRDFSMNALCLKGESGNFKLIDMVEGYRDIINRKLRLLYPASFRDDPIRMVRGIRFMHRYGCTFSQETENQARDPELKSILGQVTEGRRVQEFYKVLFEAKPFQIVQELADKGFLELLFPGLEKNIPDEDEYRTACNVSGQALPSHLQLLAFMLKHLDPGQSKYLMQHIPIRKVERKLVFDFMQNSICL